MTKSVIIIGGGVVGLCTAYYAAQRGHRVTVVERGAPDHDCCSLGNAGMIVPSHFVPLAAPGMVGLGLRMMANPGGPFAIRPRLNRDLIDWGARFCQAANAEHVRRAAPLLRDLSLASRGCFQEFAAQWDNSFGLVQQGLLMLCKTGEAFHEEAKLATMAHELGLAAQVLTPKETAQLDPNINMDIAGAVYFADDCYLSPPRFMASLTEALQELDVQFRWSTEATGWKSTDGRIEALRTRDGDLSADEYVVAGGSWSPGILCDLHLKLPLQAGKGYSMTLPQPRQLPSLCSILVEARVAVTPMGGELRFAGTMEVVGLDQSVNPNRVRGMIHSIPQYFPDFRPGDFRDVPVWRGLRPCSPDGLPYIGRTERYSNLCIATGHAMMGLNLGPITGQLISQVISDVAPSIPLELVSPDRYA